MEEPDMSYSLICNPAYKGFFEFEGLASWLFWTTAIIGLLCKLPCHKIEMTYRACFRVLFTNSFVRVATPISLEKKELRDSPKEHGIHQPRGADKH